MESIGRLKERYPPVARYYRMNYDAEASQFTFEVDQARRDTAGKLDGSYLLKTDREDLSADEVWQVYTLLTRAEAAFRALKSPLVGRPIHHYKEGCVEAHISLAEDAPGGDIVLPTEEKTELRIRKSPTPEPPHRELYEKLAVPREIFRLRKTWAPI